MAASTKKNGKTVVVALGGNAILQPGQVGTFEEQLFNIHTAMRRIAELVEDGGRVVLTHGNGPQVGNLLIQNALAAKTVAPMPSRSKASGSGGSHKAARVKKSTGHKIEPSPGAPVIDIGGARRKASGGTP